ncbi:MAG: rane spanning protein, partial [Anaerocolumna sp.]|nr:rane spanning protein [Anaerocolumna sp.]
ITYFILRKARLNFKDIIQIIATIANGYIINFFVYIILGDLVIQSYIIKIITFIMGLCLASICLGVILAIEIIKFPLEGLCIVISKKLEKQLSTVRLGFDLFFLISTLIITFLTRNNLYIREGY